MTLQCQGCDHEWDWKVPWDDSSEARELFVHEYDDPDGAGIRADYYCSIECLTGELGGTA